jgi:hypothetical protein
VNGRNRNQRLSEPQRSALWYLWRGHYTISMQSDPAMGAWFVARDARGPAVRRSVVGALVLRGLVAVDGGRKGRLAPYYGLTDEGRRVAREVCDQIDPRPSSPDLE